MTKELQGSLPFGVTQTPDDAFGKSMLALHDAYEAAGNLVIAGATGIDKSDLVKMFKPGSDRHLRYSAVFHIGCFASHELRRRALKPLANCWGLDICEPKPPRTDKERADIAEAVIRSLGPLAVDRLQVAHGCDADDAFSASFNYGAANGGRR